MSSARSVEEKNLFHSCINSLPTKVWGQ